MLEIYIIRHGRTLFNEKEMIQGWCDSPLTQAGLDQAKVVGKNMSHIPFTLAFSSPSERATDTCEAIIQNRIPITLDKRIKEINFGDLEGQLNSSLFDGKENDFHKIMRTGWVANGGENEEMLLNRIADFFSELTAKYTDETILIASHGLWVGTALKYLKGPDYSHYPIENCSVSKIIYEDGIFTIVTQGDCTYRDN